MFLRESFFPIVSQHIAIVHGTLLEKKEYYNSFFARWSSGHRWLRGVLLNTGKKINMIVEV
jgi:hypothetical protein